jgi:hypothetical protein
MILCTDFEPSAGLCAPKKNSSSTPLLDYSTHLFLSLLFLHLYSKIGTSPKPHFHLFKNSENMVE